MSRGHFDRAEDPELHESHESPQSSGSLEARVVREWLGSPKSPVFPVYPVSNGQGLSGELDKELKALAARHACTGQNMAGDKSWQFARELKAFERQTGRKLTNSERILAFGEWYRLSGRFLDATKTHNDYFTDFLAQLAKVRVPAGEGKTKQKALEAVLKLAPSELPTVPQMPSAPESWRRVMAYHRELSRLSGRNKYFLSYRDAARVCPGLSPQKVYNITLALVTVGVIEIAHKGKPGLNSRRAAEFRYLLPQIDNNTSRACSSLSRA